MRRESGDRRGRAAWAAALLAIVLVLPGAAPGLAAPGDLVFERKEGASQGIPPSIFPHWVHRIRYRCSVCHPAIFEMQAGASEITMNKIKQGEVCGRCHNGNIAFNVEFQNCTRCHRQPEE